MPDRDALDHPRRERIHETLQENPGLNWSQLQRETGLSVGVLSFHLDRLERQGHVVRKESPSENEVLLFLDEHEDLWNDPRTRVLFGNESTRKVAQYLTEDPGSIASEIAEELDVTPEAVRYHLSKLEERDLVSRERDGRAVAYEPDDPLETWFERHQRA
jgi:predicted transcriptional regulator